MELARIKTLVVILKIAERCNLACSYCYYYAPGNEAVFGRPSLMGRDVLDNVITFVGQATQAMVVENVVFAFHGGEPTLAKAALVGEFCTSARERLAGLVNSVRFAVQTNGVFLSRPWHELMVAEGMMVGISVDGDPQTHDAARVDHRGRGSYERIGANWKRLAVDAAEERIALSALTVLADPTRMLDTYLHLVNQLGVTQLKLLLPDQTHDSMQLTHGELRGFGEELCRTFDHWLVHDQGRVEVALFQDAVKRILATSDRSERIAEELTVGIAVLSDGSVRLPDDFMVLGDWFHAQGDYSVHTSQFADWLGQRNVRQMNAARTTLPQDCRSCPHANSCGGGDLPNRYSQANGFDNPSVYCPALKVFYDHVALRMQQGREVLRSAAA